MPNQVDLFIHNVIEAARQKDETKLESLLTKYGLDTMDQKGFNAAMYLGSQGDTASCDFLAKHGARWQDFANGASFSGNKNLTEYYLVKGFPLKSDYNAIAVYAAQGNHQEVAQYFLDKITDASKRNYHTVAIGAAEGEHQDKITLLDLPKEILWMILGHVPVSASAGLRQASKYLLHNYNNVLQLDLNKAKSLGQPSFEIDEEGKNPDLEKQLEEINYLLKNEQCILKKTKHSPVIQNCLNKLKAEKIIIDDTFGFLRREYLLDKTNIENIRQRIQESKSVDAQRLDCTNCHLTRFTREVITHPGEEIYWSNLTFLNLSHNQLQSLPTVIGQLVALTCLDLSENQLQILPAEIGQLVALTFLNLSHNQLQILPAAIGQLVALERLNLSNNQLKTLPAAIEQLLVLTELHLSNNQLQTLPAAIGQLVALEGLNLSNNQLQTLPAAIGQLVALRWLNIDNNQLQTLPAAIGQLVALTMLFLNNNQLKTFPAEIGQLVALKYLNINNNQLKRLPDNLREEILKYGGGLEATKVGVLASQKARSSKHDILYAQAEELVDGSNEITKPEDGATKRKKPKSG